MSGSRKLMVRCDECGGMGTLTVAVDTGVIGTGYYREDLCHVCDGEGEIEALCPFCDNPVDELGWCQRCREPVISILDLTAEKLADPFKRKAA